MNRRIFNLVVIFSFGLSIVAFGQDKPRSGTDDPAAKSNRDAKQEKLHQRLSEQLLKVKFVGQFTVIGRGDEPLAKDEYTIHRVEKLAEGDKWMFHCRIKYGDHDLSIPLPIDVKWADETPVITLDDLTIPGLGTFSARVVIHDNKYAGTWRHDKVTGHLFGTIVKLEEKEDPKTPPPNGDRKKD